MSRDASVMLPISRAPADAGIELADSCSVLAAAGSEAMAGARCDGGLTAKSDGSIWAAPVADGAATVLDGTPA
ncbi:hypothetical protein AQ862_27765 [Burkholderia pseudomallei]|nr:hypothetical protein AQ862_27765 [Burkholderia pseudomallei]